MPGARRSIVALAFALAASPAAGATAPPPSHPAEQIGFHNVRVDAKGAILPWYSADPGASYDHVLRLVWAFWRDMKTCPNGVKYYLQHQVWAHPLEDARGIGGDQLSMALSSWSRLYPYLGDPAIVENMRLLADHWLDHGMSPASAKWPNLPFPYNTTLHSGVLDGDMTAGKGVLQPDKAANFGFELVVLHQMTGEPRYRAAAVAIADTLAARIEPGDEDRSPWPFRVHAFTGTVVGAYTANWTGALRLFDGLLRLGWGDAAAYARARGVLAGWMKREPLRTNKWGPFFEDVEGWSDTETNADTMAAYVLDEPSFDPAWRAQARGILEWSRATFANPAWAHLGVRPINEQTGYPVPGNSHTSRHASVQLLYADRTGDARLKAEAVRQLHWATYMVSETGENNYFLDNVWLTDGYGDYVRHYLRAMAAAPELAPRDQSHLLWSTSPVRSVTYAVDSVAYETAEPAAEDTLRVAFRPTAVTAGGVPLPRLAARADLARGEGYTFEGEGDAPGVVRVRHAASGTIAISAAPVDAPPAVADSALRTRSGETVAVALAATDDGPRERLTYRTHGPYHGRLDGTAPDLRYTSNADFVGTDVITWSAGDGESQSAVARVVVTVEAPPPTHRPPGPPAIEYETEDQIVAEGNTTTFAVRLRGNAPARLQWETSGDGGRTWAAVPGANGITLAVTPQSAREDDGRLFRCVATNAAPGRALSRPLKLTVRPRGAGPLNNSRWMIDCSRPAEGPRHAGLPDCALVLGVPSLGAGSLAPVEPKP